MRLTVQRVAEITADRTWERHAFFIHCVLGEPWPLAAHFADAVKHTELSVEAMRLIEGDWREEGWGPSHSTSGGTVARP